ncbi:MAG: serpin family protein [Oscillospiraceae bacterium]|nr:serpin family protein [Oscillospiraceae bacterium]
MKQQKLMALSAALTLLVSMTGCTGRTAAAQTVALTQNLKAEQVQGLDPDAEFLSGQNAFAFTLMQNAAKDAPGSNILISPFSLMQVLALTANGAGGETRAEIEQMLGGIPTDTLNKYLYSYRTNMPDTEKARFHTANSVWLREEKGTFPAKETFLHTASDYYGAEIYSSPFDNKAVDIVNKWCSDNTAGMIPKLIDAFSEESVMMLINAVIFDAKWENPYENEPSKHQFRTASGQEKECSMMYSQELYLEDEAAEGFWKPYADGYAFAAILPKNDLSPEEYLAQQTPDSLSALLHDIEQPEYANTGLPQFKLDYTTNLIPLLKKMNMNSAFGGNADFSGIADSQLNIGTIMQKAVIEVNTEGTKAAAATVEVLDSALAPETEHEVILDRPFLYMIVDTDTMLPIFTGILNTPES